MFKLWQEQKLAIMLYIGQHNLLNDKSEIITASKHSRTLLLSNYETGCGYLHIIWQFLPRFSPFSLAYTSGIIMYIRLSWNGIYTFTCRRYLISIKLCWNERITSKFRGYKNATTLRNRVKLLIVVWKCYSPFWSMDVHSLWSLTSSLFLFPLFLFFYFFHCFLTFFIDLFFIAIVFCLDLGVCTCVCTDVFICVPIRAHACVHAYIQTYTYTYPHLCVYVFMYARLIVSLCLCIYVNSICLRWYRVFYSCLII